MLDRQMSRDDLGSLAREAEQIRWPGEASYLEAPAALLTARRGEDAGTDLWRAYNRVQENVLNGHPAMRSTDGRAIRKVLGVATAAKINARLFDLAVGYL
jgi:hypothetical protein